MNGRPVRLVFVHGIGKPRPIAEQKAAWTSALMEGAVLSGHSRFAEQLDGGRFDIEFAHYADLYDKKGGRADGLDLTDEEAVLLTALLTEIVTELKSGSGGDPGPTGADERTRAVIRAAEAQLDPQSESPQGALELVRVAINVATSLLSLPLLRRPSQWATARLMAGDLAQVARYLARKEIDPAGITLDARIRARLSVAFGSGPAVIVAHSLGSVATYETLHLHPIDVPLLVTIGSPIGMRLAVWPRLKPATGITPPSVCRWLNAWDRDDIIAARPGLERIIATNEHGAGPKTVRVDSDGVWTHKALSYLASAQVAGPIAEVMITVAGIC